MAGMKRFVTYIYAYEDKKKGNNIGFAKIEIRGEACRVEIHLRGVYARQSTCIIYLFREATGVIEGIPIGELRLANGNGDFSGIIKAAHIGGSPFSMNHMEGIFLLTEDDRIFMSRWKEGNPLVVCRENFRVWQPAQAQNEVTEDVKSDETGNVKPGVKEQERADAELEVNVQDTEIPKTENMAQNETTAEQLHEQIEAVENTRSEETMQATEVPMHNVFPDYDWQSIWESLTQSHKLYHPFEDSAAECIQIELKNLRELPKRYWYLGNNSFLLHGFFNYHYLVVGRTVDARWFIGVPGIYQRQERVMAAIFGFPEFLAMAQEEKEGEENGEPLNRFGCWCRYIEE